MKNARLLSDKLRLLLAEDPPLPSGVTFVKATDWHSELRHVSTDGHIIVNCDKVYDIYTDRDCYVLYIFYNHGAGTPVQFTRTNRIYLPETRKDVNTFIKSNISYLAKKIKNQLNNS